MHDLLIKNARIIDGTGAPWYRGDLAVKGGKIVELGTFSALSALQVVDADDKYLTPGFIDIHTHSDDSLIYEPLAESRIFQGVTTEIGGNCGTSPAPINPDFVHLTKVVKEYSSRSYSWQTLGEYLNILMRKAPSVNIGVLVGHGTLRTAAMGFSADPATHGQIETMKNYAVNAMEDGAFGLSSGLIYPPGSFANIDELSRVASAIAPYGGIYATHMREEGAHVVASVEEAIETARLARVPLQISHHKVTHRANWGISCKTTIAMIRQARRMGLDVTCDQYPYTASATSLTSNVPEWAFEGGLDMLITRLIDPETRAILRNQSNASHAGRWDCIHISHLGSEKNSWMIGKPVTEIAQKLNMDVAEAVFDIIIEENGNVGEINFGMCEEDIEYIMSQPFTMIGSDGRSMPVASEGRPHPRNYGTFPRAIARYCRDRGLFPLETAIAKMTSMPAARLTLKNRGILRPGAWADMVIFDFDRIQDNPTYEMPQCACDGINQVFVNGVLTAENGRHTGATAGQVLRKNRQ